MTEAAADAPPLRVLFFAFATYALVLRALIDRGRADGVPIRWGAIVPRRAFLGEVAASVPESDRLYLFQDFARVFASTPTAPALDGAEDNLARVMAVDKDGYRHESSAFQERSAATMLALMGAFLDRFRPDCVVFPPLETVDGVLLLSLCQARGIACAHMVHMRNMGESFFSPSLYETLPPYFGPATDADRCKAERFIAEFRAGTRHPLDMPAAAQGPPVIAFTPPPLTLRLLRSLADRLGPERLYRGEDGFVLRVKRNLVRPLYAFRRWRHRATRGRIFHILSETDPIPDRFVLYAAQVSPESSINTLAQFFVAQERVIDLLRFAVPPGYTLLVKEHPAMAGSRPFGFYARLRRMAGVRLVAPEVPMAALLARAALVTSVTGTVGLEAYLAGKPSLLFGRSFFSHLCGRADRIDGLAAEVARLIGQPPAGEEEMREEIARLYHVAYRFAPFEPVYRPEVLSAGNIGAMLHGLIDHLARLQDVRSAAAAARP